MSDHFYTDHKPGVGLMTALGKAPEEIRFNRLTFELRNLLYKVRSRQTKRLEIEAANLIREIQTYGFKFVPEFYVTPLLDKLDRIHEEFKRVGQSAD